MAGAVVSVRCFWCHFSFAEAYCYKLFRHVNSYQDQVFFHFLTRFLTSMQCRPVPTGSPELRVIPTKTAALNNLST